MAQELANLVNPTVLDFDDTPVAEIEDGYETYPKAHMSEEAGIAFTILDFKLCQTAEYGDRMLLTIFFPEEDEVAGIGPDGEVVYQLYSMWTNARILKQLKDQDAAAICPFRASLEAIKTRKGTTYRLTSAKAATRFRHPVKQVTGAKSKAS